MDRGTVLLFMLLASLSLSACVADSDRQNAHVEARSSDADSSRRYIIDEEPPLISGIAAVEHVGRDSLLIVDDRLTAFLIVGREKQISIDAQGDGPCQYQRLTAFDVATDSLFVLDAGRGKVLSFSLRDGRCGNEYQNPELVKFRSMAHVDGSFYLTVHSFALRSPADQPLLYRLTPGNELTPLSLTRGQIEASMLVAPVSIPALPMRVSGERLWFLLPQVHRLFWLETASGEVSSMPLQHDSVSLEAFEDETDPDVVMDLVRNELEMETDFFLLPERIAVLSRKGSGDARRWMLRYYTYSGEVVESIELERPVWHLDERHAWQWGEAESDMEGVYPEPIVQIEHSPLR